MQLCGTYGLDIRMAEQWTPAEFSAWVDGAHERKKDGDLRLASVVRAVLGGAGMKHPPSIYAIAGYRETLAPDAFLEALDPDAKRDNEREAREARRAEHLERMHREWLEEAGIE